MATLFGLNRKINQIKNFDNKIEEKKEINKLPKKKIEIENHIKDLENTLKINQEYIYNVILVLPICQKNKRKLVATLERIKLLFNEKKQYRKEEVDISSKILINKQIIEEIKRRNNENLIYQNDKIKNYKESVNKKEILVKNFIKKFNELEIFVQRESVYPENKEKYGKWKTFTVLPFMKKNEYLIKKKKFYEINNRDRKIIMEKIRAENNFIKQSKSVKIDFNENINNNYNLIQNYYLNIFSITEKEIEIIKNMMNLIMRKKFQNNNKLINDTIFEYKKQKSINSGELMNKCNDEDIKKNDININNDFLFAFNENEIKDMKEISNNHNYWIDFEPDEI